MTLVMNLVMLRCVDGLGNNGQPKDTPGATDNVGLHCEVIHLLYVAFVLPAHHRTLAPEGTTLVVTLVQIRARESIVGRISHAPCARPVCGKLSLVV